MRKVISYVMALMVGLALMQMAGCKKAEDKGGDGTKDKGGQAASQADKLVGVWKGKPTPKDPAKKGGPDIELTFEFKKGGALTMSVAGMPMNGTWESLGAEGNKIKLKATIEPPDLGPLAKGKDVKVEKNTDEFEVIFLSDDQITMAPTKDPNDLVTLNRQK